MTQSIKNTQHLTSGKNAEALAQVFLHENGVKTIETNYNTKCGELDIIALDKNCLVFVEVRFRKNANFGSPLESVTASKQRKLRLTAEHYLLTHPTANHTSARFDVIGICGQDIQWIQNAF